jgi:protein-tyrosine-phosphatase
MKRDELEKILQVRLERRRGPIKRTARYIPAIPDLYHAGCSLDQVRRLFGVSRKFVQTHLRAAGVKARTAAVGKATPSPKPERIIAILKKHGLSLEDLPGPRPQPGETASTPGATPRRKAKKKP